MMDGGGGGDGGGSGSGSCCSGGGCCSNGGGSSSSCGDIMITGIPILDEFINSIPCWCASIYYSNSLSSAGHRNIYI